MDNVQAAPRDKLDLMLLNDTTINARENRAI